MSEWNLSVQLTGQGSDLATTLKESAKEARKLTNRINDAKQALTELRAEAANDITVRLDIDADHLRNDVSAALTSAGSGQGLRVRLDLDADHLRDDVNAAISTAGTGQGLGVSLRLTDTMQLRREVENAVRWAAWGHRIEIPIGLADPMQLRRDVSAAVRWASMNQTITVRVTPDTSALNGLNNTINRGGGSGGGSNGGGGMRQALMGLLMLAPAAIPLVAGLSTALAPLPGQFAAVAVPAAAFGAALAGQIEPLTQAADAEKKYHEAVQQHGRASAEAIKAQIAYQKTLAALPPDTQRAAVALSQLKQNFGDWSDDMSAFTMTPLTNGITVLDQLIPRLTPQVKTASAQLNRLVAVAGGAVNTPGFDAMADRFADFTDHQLDEMTDQVMHFLRVLSEGGAFKSGPIAEFMAYAKENGPAAREALKALSDAVVTLLRGASEAGPGMLTLVTAAAKLVAALPPELVGIILQVATALKLLQLSGAGMAALAGGLTRVRAAIAGLTAASAAAGGGMAGLRAAFMSLGVAARATLIASGIGVLLVALSALSDMGKKTPPDVDKLTTSLRTLGSTGKVSGEAARSFGKDLSGFADSLEKVTDPKGLDQVQQSIVSFFGTDSTPIKDAKDNINAVDQALANLVKNGQGDLAAAALERITAEMKKEGYTTKQVTSQMDDYKSALADQAFEQKLAAESMGVFGKAAQDTQAKLDAQKQSADGLRQSIVALNDVNRAAGSAMSTFEQSLDDATAAIKDHAGALKMRDGELDLGSSKSREAEKSLSDLAANTDAAAAAAREQGKSWKYVNDIYSRGRKAFIDAADAMGLTRAQAEALADTYLEIPDNKKVVLEMQTEDAIANLDSVIAEIKKTPNAKSVTVKALTAEAQTLLEQLGFKIVKLKDGKFSVIADTASAKTRLSDVEAARDGLKNKTIKIDAATQQTIADLEAVKAKVASTNGKTIPMKALTAEARAQLEALGFKIKNTKGKNVVITVPTGSQRSGVNSLRDAISALHDKSITITTTRQTVFTTKGSKSAVAPAHRDYGAQANGSVLDFYANGGIQRGGLRRFAQGAENHVAQIAPAGSWRVWGEPETMGEGYVPFAPSKRPRSRKITEEIVRRLGGNPEAIQWNAQGSVTDWRYDPQSGSLYSTSDAGQAGHKTRKVKVKGKGGKVTIKEIEYFDLSAVEKKIKSTAKATQSWNKDLEKVADRVGGDVAQALAAMGADGVKLAHKMATGSTKYINDMAAALRNLQKTANASLTDYTRQLGKANTLNKTFSDNLAKLAAQGYGDLASQLAAQNDESAQQLAASAVKDKGKASKANTAAKTANNALTSGQVAELVEIIAAIKTKSTGIHAVAAATNLGEDEIITVGTKAKAQISKSLGDRATKFLADLSRAGKGLSYANGGIRPGIYATRGGAVTFAEPETGGEAFLPLSPSKRRSAMPVLNDVAHRFGVGLTDVAASRGVVIIREGGDTHVSVTAVRTGATASDIGSQVGRSVRRARRGGVNARAGS
jgi:hypothetical protein